MTVTTGHVDLMTWWNGMETCALHFRVSWGTYPLTGAVVAYRETLDAAMLIVKSEENASNVICSLTPSFVRVSRPVATSSQHPTDVAVACMTVSIHGASTCLRSETPSVCASC